MKIAKTIAAITICTLTITFNSWNVYADGAEDWQAFLKEECPSPRTSNHYHEIDDSYIYTDPSTGIILFGIKCGRCNKEYRGDINDFLKCKIYPWSYYAGANYSIARTMQGYFDDECSQGGYHTFRATYQYSGSDKWKVDMECTKCGRIVNKFYTTTLCDLDNHLTEDYVAFIPTPTPEPTDILEPTPEPAPEPTPIPEPDPVIQYDGMETISGNSIRFYEDTGQRLYNIEQAAINNSVSLNEIKEMLNLYDSKFSNIESYTRSISENTLELVNQNRNDINNSDMLDQLSGNIEDLNKKLTELSTYLGYFFAFMIFIMIAFIFRMTWKLIDKYLLNTTLR